MRNERRERGSQTPASQTVEFPPRSPLRRSPVAGPRILLVPIDASDGPELWEAVDGSRWHLERWLPWVPFNTPPEASLRYAEACAVDWDQGRAARFAVRDRQSHELIGVVGLDSCVHLHRSCELGYWLRREFTGRGLMTEAARGLIEAAHRTHHFEVIAARALADNAGSLNVLGKLGFKPVKKPKREVGKIKDRPTVTLELERPRWM